MCGGWVGWWTSAKAERATAAKRSLQASAPPAGAAAHGRAAHDRVAALGQRRAVGQEGDVLVELLRKDEAAEARHLAARLRGQQRGDSGTYLSTSRPWAMSTSPAQPWRARHDWPAAEGESGV